MSKPICCNMCQQCVSYFDSANMNKRVFQCAKSRYDVIGKTVDDINGDFPVLGKYCPADDNDGLRKTKHSDWENDW